MTLDQAAVNQVSIHTQTRERESVQASDRASERARESDLSIYTDELKCKNNY